MEVSGPPASPTGWRRLLYRAPIHLYRLGLGWLLGSRFVLIEHIGRRTGLVRRTVVEVVDRDGTTVTVAAGFGTRSDWYRNLLARPDATIQLGRRRFAVHAVDLPPGARAKALLHYVHKHPRAARGLAKFMGFRVDGSESDYREMAEHLHMLRLEAR